MSEPPAPPPAPDLTAIETRLALCTPPAATDLYNHEEQLMYQDVPTLVAYARALDAANARLRAGLEELRLSHRNADTLLETCALLWSDTFAQGIDPVYAAWVGTCTCGADEHNALIDALLTTP